MLHFERGQYNEHTNDKALDTYELPKAPTNVKRASTWQGIPHGDLARAIITSLKKLFNVVPLTQTYAVAPNGMTMLGSIELGQKPKGKRKAQPLLVDGVPHETTQAIGFMHSNDRRHSLQVCFGGSVMVCTNGMVVGSETWKRRHTTGLNLFDWIAECLNSMWNSMKETAKKVTHLAQYSITPEEHDRNLLYMGRQGILPWKWVGAVDKEWQTASNSSTHAFNQGTLWDWYNCVTEVIKQLATALQFPALERAYSVARYTLPDELRQDEYSAFQESRNTVEGTVNSSTSPRRRRRSS